MRPTSAWLLLLLCPGVASLHMVFGAHNIPHPSKAHKGGEDAYFYDDRMGTFGIADGVGGSAKNGVDPGLFSREILKRCHESAAQLANQVNGMRMNEALRMASSAPLDMPGSSTLVLGQLEMGTDTLRLLNLGDSGAMVFRPSLRKFGEMKVKFPRTVLDTKDQSHFWNCPYQANAKNFGGVCEELDEISAPVKEGDVVIAASDGVLDNLFEMDLQACISDSLNTLMGDDPHAAQQCINDLAKSIAE